VSSRAGWACEPFPSSMTLPALVATPLRCPHGPAPPPAPHVTDPLSSTQEDLILPHHHTFYELIINKARGKSGPLFDFG
jgi:hypothetical protein